MSPTPTGPSAAQRRAARSRAHVRRLVAGVPLGILATALATLALAPSGSAGAAAGGANIRLAHLSPDTPEMDVYVVGFDGSESKALEGLGYGEVSDYAPLDAGEYTFLLRPAGAPADSDPAVTASATLDSGDAYTFAAMGPNADLQQALLTDDLAAPPGGQAKVRLIQASSTAAEVPSRSRAAPCWRRTCPSRTRPATPTSPPASGRSPPPPAPARRVSRSLSPRPRHRQLPRRAGGHRRRAVRRHPRGRRHRRRRHRRSPRRGPGHHHRHPARRRGDRRRRHGRPDRCRCRSARAAA